MNHIIETTVGRVLLMSMFLKKLDSLMKFLTKKSLRDIIGMY